MNYLYTFYKNYFNQICFKLFQNLMIMYKKYYNPLIINKNIQNLIPLINYIQIN